MKTTELPGLPVKFPLGWRGRIVRGGPYREFPGKPMYGVKMAVEIDMPYDINIPTQDFKTPPVESMVEGVKKAIEAMARGERVYVGCWGGTGRTGLFLACLAKALDIPDPVKWVRANYKPHAVETKDQERYVREFPVSEVQSTANRARLVSKLYFWK